MSYEQHCAPLCYDDGRPIVIPRLSGDELEVRAKTFTYFLLCPPLNRLKIGRTRDVEKRICAIANASPVPCVLLGVLPGDFETELHIEFAEYRRHLEWFDFERRLKQFVCELDIEDMGDIRLSDPDATSDTLMKLMDECGYPPVSDDELSEAFAAPKDGGQP